MSMCVIAYTFRGVTKAVDHHYAGGIMDWRKYHREQAAYWKQEVKKGYPIEGYAEEMLAFHQKAAATRFHNPPLNLGGIEGPARKNGYWMVRTPAQAERWVKSLPEGNIQPCADPSRHWLHLNFDTFTATVNTDNPYCNWESYLPSNWKVELVTGDLDG